MVLHLVSLEEPDPISAYYTISNELSKYSSELATKEQWIILSKKDLVEQDKIDAVLQSLDRDEKRVFVIGQNDPESIKKLADALVLHLRQR